MLFSSAQRFLPTNPFAPVTSIFISFLYHQILGSDRGIGAILDFYNDTRFSHDYGMPLPHRNLNSIIARRAVKYKSCCFIAVIVIEQFSKGTPQDQKRFRSVLMSMNRNDRARTEGVQKALRFVFGGGSQIIIHAQPRILGGLPINGIQKFIVYQY